MKRSILTVLLAIGFLSCSSDKEDPNETDQNVLVGTWQATALKINSETASDGAKFGRDILDYLTARQCYIYTLTFKADNSLVLKYSGNYLQVNAGVSGLEIPCPTEEDVVTGTYTYDGNVLTIAGLDSNTTDVRIDIEGSTMSIEVSQLNIDNFEDGELILRKK